MSKEIVTIDQVKALEALSEHAFNSKHFERLGGKSGLFCIAMYAQELGLNPMTCLFGGMRPIQGNIELSPRMMNSMIRKAGHKIHILRSTDTECVLKGERCDTKETYECTFTLEDARRAGLVRSGGSWDKFPSDMLFARCLSRLARRLFSDVISTAYIEGEIEDEVEEVVKEPQQEAVVVEELISKEECDALESLILEFDDALDYRKRLLTSCTKQYGEMSDFTKLPKKGYDALLSAIQRRKDKQTKKTDLANVGES